MSGFQNQVCAESVEPFKNPNDFLILALVELVLVVVIFLTVFVLLRIDCKYDPDWSLPPPQHVGGEVSVIGGISVLRRVSVPSTTATTCDRVGKIAWVV